MSKSTSKKSAKSTSKKSATSAAIMALLKRPGACGGRGARTALIENYVASRSKSGGATVSEIETALQAPEIVATDVVQSMAQGRVAAIRNHVATLFSKSLLKRDDTTHKYSVVVASAKKSASK